MNRLLYGAGQGRYAHTFTAAEALLKEKDGGGRRRSSNPSGMYE